MAGPFERRRQRRINATPRPRRAVRASAQKLPLEDRKIVQKNWARRQEWQDEAWTYFDDVPEIKQLVWLQSNIMAKARWFAAVRDPDDPEADPIPVNDEKSGVRPELAKAATEELRRLRGPLGGLTEIVRELNMNLEIAAEAYIVGFGAVLAADGTVTPEEWDIKSVSEVENLSGKVKIKASPTDQYPRELDPDTDTIIRVWQRHPRWSMLPDCAMRGVLGECEALVLLSNQVKAEAKSRTPAGILLLSNDLTLGPQGAHGDEQAVADEPGEDDVLDVLYTAFTDAIEDPSSASAVSPVVLQGPPESLKEARHLTIGRDTSAVLEQRIAARVERLARGMNAPVEVVMGHQQTTFANAEQVSEDEYTKHSQPRLILMADALSVGFLQPNLLDAGFAQEEIENVVVWFDPADMVKQTDPLQSATEGLNLDLISEEAWRRLKGFSEDDAPEPLERLLRLVFHLRTFDPGITTAILELLGVPLNIPQALPSPGGAPAAVAPQASANPALQAMLTAAVEAQRHGEPIGAQALVDAATAGRTAESTLIQKIGDDQRALVAARPPRASQSNVGYRLMLIDRDLRSKLLVAANAALNHALERAGNKLRSKVKAGSDMREALRTVDALHVASTLGRPLVAAAAIGDDDLIGGSAWDALEEQFMAWGSQAQTQALAAVKDVVGLTDAARAALEHRQFSDLTEAWTWMKDALHDLSVARLYHPDPFAPEIGEFDPTSRVPTGLVRQAVARAGGASSVVTVQDGDPYVILNNGEPVGGIATGELVMETLTGADVLVEGYVWVYGPAFRAHPFEEHEALDGEVFVNFDDDVLVAGDWIGDYYFPGDHDGCCCDIAPTLVPPEDIALSAE